MEREAAAELIRWRYWEPRVFPTERQFYPGGAFRVVMGRLVFGPNPSQRWVAPSRS